MAKQLRPEPRTKPLAERSRARVALVALLPGLGAGHFVAGDRLSGVLLGVAELGSVVAGLTGRPLFFWAVPIVVLCDLVGAQLVIGERRAGRAAVALGRTAAILGVGAALLLPAMRATSPEALAAPAGVLACEATAECGGEARMLCIEHLADRRMSNDLSIRALEACAACIEPATGCGEVARCRTECVGVVDLPRRGRPGGDDFVRMLDALPGMDSETVEAARERPTE